MEMNIKLDYGDIKFKDNGKLKLLTRRLNLQETIDTISELEYIQGRLAEDK